MPKHYRSGMGSVALLSLGQGPFWDGQSCNSRLYLLNKQDGKKLMLCGLCFLFLQSCGIEEKMGIWWKILLQAGIDFLQESILYLQSWANLELMSVQKQIVLLKNGIHLERTLSWNRIRIFFSWGEFSKPC